MSPFADPNDPRKAAINRMIRKLLIHRDMKLRSLKCLPKFNTHGNLIDTSEEAKAAESKKYANIKVINSLITKLENLVY